MIKGMRSASTPQECCSWRECEVKVQAALTDAFRSVCAADRGRYAWKVTWYFSAGHGVMIPPKKSGFSRLTSSSKPESNCITNQDGPHSLHRRLVSHQPIFQIYAETALFPSLNRDLPTTCISPVVSYGLPPLYPAAL